MLVTALGYKALQSHSPHEALEQIKGESIDLLLSDFEMPKMDGLEPVAHLRNEGYTFPVILMWSKIRAIDLDRAQQLGIVMILENPFGVAVIRAALKAILK